MADNIGAVGIDLYPQLTLTTYRIRPLDKPTVADEFIDLTITLGLEYGWFKVNAGVRVSVQDEPDSHPLGVVTAYRFLCWFHFSINLRLKPDGFYDKG